ncbi:M15 family metallopeptidase [Candidatus Sumerlaeota bacterium]|nr:M15 family metallopeptidase [Candidatus Sumerlaeota bacterium]
MRPTRIGPVETPEPDRPREPIWQVLQRRPDGVCARFVGEWDRVRSGSLVADDFRSLSPPDMAAGLGLATVYGPDTAGWFLSTGRFIHLKTTDSGRGYPTFSYESLARLGWAIGVTSGTAPSARILFDCGPETPPSLDEAIERLMAEARDTGAWLVAGHVVFSRVRGQSLQRAPADGVALNDESDPGNPRRSLSLPVENGRAPGLVVALVLDPEAIEKPVVSALARRFFETSRPKDGKRFLVRAHYALFGDPAPTIDPSLPLAGIWDVDEKEAAPHVETVRVALEGTVLERGHFAVWSIDVLERGYPRREVDLVDVAEVDPTILYEPRWATNRNFLGRPIYDRPRAMLVRPVAEAAARVNARLNARGFRLKIYDAYRPLSVTQRLWLQYPGTPYLAAPNRGSRHNRGAAIDCTLTDLEGTDVEMPSDFTVFDETSHRDYPYMSESARRHLDILTRAMEAEGFTTIREEWWHYDGPHWPNYPVVDVPFWPGPEDASRVDPPLIIDNRTSENGLSSRGASSHSGATSRVLPVFHDSETTEGVGPPEPIEAPGEIDTTDETRSALPMRERVARKEPERDSRSDSWETPTAPAPIGVPSDAGPAVGRVDRTRSYWVVGAAVAVFFVAFFLSLFHRS